MENQNNNIKNSGRVWGGVIILLMGVGFLLNNLGLHIPGWIFSWSTLMILLGLFVGARRQFRGIGWLILLLLGTYGTLNRLNLDVDLSKYAAGFALVIIGFFLIVRPKSSGFNKKNKQKFKQKFDFETAQSSTEYGSNDVLDVMSVFGGSHQTVYSKNFKGGDVTVVFGGADINLTQTEFEQTVRLDITAVFGGIKLIVPQNWAIKSNVTALFGSVEDKRAQYIQVDDIQKILVLDGTAMFGGIEIKSF